MENILNYFKIIIAALGTGITWLFGTWDTALIVLVSFMALDYLTGVLRAIVNQDVLKNKHMEAKKRCNKC